MDSPCSFVLLLKVGILKIIYFIDFSFRVSSPSDDRISGWKILCHVRHKRCFPAHSGGDADLPEGPGHSCGVHYVHVLQYGLTIHCLLSKILVAGL